MKQAVQLDKEAVKALAQKAVSDAFQNVISKTKSASEKEAGYFKVVISTDDVDRAGESIMITGWDLEHYKKNPIVLWGHSHNELPIGVATNIYQEGNKLVAEGKFALHERAQEVREMYEMGIVKATSVGFIPKKFADDGDTIIEAELLEFSFVSVPMNPHALSVLSSSELSIDKLVAKGFFEMKKENENEEVVEEETNDEEETTKEEETTEEPTNEETDSEETTDEEEKGGEEVEEDKEEVEEPEEEKEATEEETTEDAEKEEDDEYDTDEEKMIARVVRREITVALQQFKSEDAKRDDDTATDEQDSVDDVVDDVAKNWSEEDKKKRIVQMASAVISEHLAEKKRKD